MEQLNRDDAIAIIGINGRFSGCDNLEDLWTLLSTGKTAIRSHTREQLLAAGKAPSLIDDKNYVANSMLLDGTHFFDHQFFGFSERQGRLMDPQNRLLLESSWHAFEDAGYAPLQTGKEHTVGVFAGKNPSLYYQRNVLPHVLSGKKTVTLSEQLEVDTTNGTDFTAHWLAYKFGFTGPALNIQTSCSTGLSVVAVACQNLLTYHCDLALAAVAGLTLNQQMGYLYQENNVLSADGHCRPLDANASGTVNGSGVVSVVLKRYEDALADRDRIYALIVGVGINNDGSRKQDFMAPGVQGQAQAIRMALSQAALTPNDIDYVELHGTGTKLGDPVEITALKTAYGDMTDRSRPCHLGSLKANIGHLNACAGLAGLVKIVLSMRHHVIPPLANFTSLNPYIQLDQRSFAVNTENVAWEREGDKPHRAGQNAFGFGGTNVHIILEEFFPDESLEPPEKPLLEFPLAFLSAASDSQVRTLLGSWRSFSKNANPRLADVSYTSLAGREHFKHRAAVRLDDWNGLDIEQAVVQKAADDPRFCWIFTGQGETLSPGMGRQLYLRLSAFRHAIDECRSLLGERLAARIWPDSEASWDLHCPSVLQPAIFMMQYALARVWQSLGLEPACVIGHSIGEIAAVCIAGGLSLEQALNLACARGQAFEACAGDHGGMLAVFSEVKALPELPADVVIAAYNAPDVQVVSGGKDKLGEYADSCRVKGIQTFPLNVTHAFHSPLVQNVADEFARNMRNLQTSVPGIPVFSTLTGCRLDAGADMDHWLRHLLSPTLFSDALTEAVKTHGITMAVEIGPRSLLAGLIRKTGIAVAQAARDCDNEYADILEALAQLYRHGFVPRQQGLFPRPGRRITLPGYPFKKVPLWIDPPARQHEEKADEKSLAEDAVASSAVLRSLSTAVDVSGSHEDPDPLDEAEELLNLILSYWREYLGVQVAVPDDDFFAQGGTSLGAILIQEAIKKEFGVSIGMAEFMSARTPQKISDLVLERLMAETVEE